MNEHDVFLQQVRNYVSKHPDVSPYINAHIAQGIKDRLDLENKVSADVEAALIAATTKGFRNRDEFILGKIKKWKDKLRFNFNSNIEYLESKVKR